MKKINYIDLGARAGEEIDLLLTQFGQHKSEFILSIYAIDADTSWTNVLLQKYRDHKNVHIFNVAICNIDAPTILYLDIQQRLGSSVFPSKTNVDKNTYIKVPGQKLSSIIKNNIPDFDTSINILKLNIEGAELLVYRDLIENNLLKSFGIICGHPTHDIYKVPELAANIPEYLDILSNNNISIEYFCAEDSKSVNRCVNLFKLIKSKQ